MLRQKRGKGSLGKLTAKEPSQGSRPAKVGRGGTRRTCAETCWWAGLCHKSLKKKVGRKRLLTKGGKALRPGRCPRR